jgi:hypothetical protein
VSPVKYKLGFYIPEDANLHHALSLKPFCSRVVVVWWLILLTEVCIERFLLFSFLEVYFTLLSGLWSSKILALCSSVGRLPAFLEGP